MNSWPPKPGFTVIMSIMSTYSSISSMAARDVEGLRATPDFRAYGAYLLHGTMEVG